MRHKHKKKEINLTLFDTNKDLVEQMYGKIPYFFLTNHYADIQHGRSYQLKPDISP